MTAVNAIPGGRANNGLAAVVRFVRWHPAGGITALLGTMLLICVIVGLIVPDDFRFLTGVNVKITLSAIPFIGISALGVGMLMIAGEFDLSIGASSTLAAVLMAMAYNAGAHVAVAMFVGIAVAVVIGVANGLVTTRFGIPSFITTLSMMLVLRGANRVVTGGVFQRFYPDQSIRNAVAGTIDLGFQKIPAQILWFIGFAVVAYLIMHRHRLGNHFYAVGGDKRAAIAVGVDADRTKIIAFVFAAVGATIAAIISTTRVSAISPFQSQAGLEFDTIAACVVGGIFLSGGRGSVFGIVLGAVLIYLVEDILLLSGAPSFYLEAFVGAVIVAAVVTNTWVAKRTI